jgi:hypothetical protein
MSKTATYALIEKQTTSSTTNTVTFSSIPNTYTDLIIISDSRGAGPNFLGYRFNSDTGSNYSFTALTGNGSAASSSRSSNATNLGMGLVNSNPFNLFYLFDYANTTTYKTALSKRGDAAFGIDAYSGLWRNTAAINAITIFSGSNFDTGSTFKLYGIQAGNA